MRQKIINPLILILFAAILLMGCGGGDRVKPLTTPFDSVVIDTTAALEHGDVCKIHLKFHIFKGKNAAVLNDSLLRMGILQPDYMALSYDRLVPQTALRNFVRRLIEEQEQAFRRIRSREPDTKPLLYELSCDTRVLAGADKGVVYVARITTADNSGEPLTWTVVRNIAPNGRWVKLEDIYNKEEMAELPHEIMKQLTDDLSLDDSTAVRKNGYFAGIEAYATDNFMLFDDSVRFVYVPGEIALQPVNITLKR